MAAAALNDEIQNVSYYNIRHLALHGYIAPFICLYLIWFYLLMFVYGVEEYFEASLIALAVIGLLQILVSLFCLWSVDVRCALTCSKVSPICPNSNIKKPLIGLKGYCSIRKERRKSIVRPIF